jgi:class 3 adenylate cyclase
VQIPSGTVTLLFTDIEGSTRLWETEPEQMASALRRHDQILRSAIEQASGFVFKTVGDAFCAAFSSSRSAVEAVLAAQRALTAESWPTARPIRVRMGLHAGVCEERDGDYFGPVVNRTARLEAIALRPGRPVAWRGRQAAGACGVSELVQHPAEGLVGLVQHLGLVDGGQPAALHHDLAVDDRGIHATAVGREH